ncbi:MAG: hypothetical protein ACOZBL_00530 [Patescibacteria group bacterium]
MIESIPGQFDVRQDAVKQSLMMLSLHQKHQVRISSTIIFD